jgi:hypothetical protein
MAYADDIIIVSRSLRAMKEIYKAIKTIAKTTGLEVNVNKTNLEGTQGKPEKLIWKGM